MPTSNREYTSFLIRLWREPPASVAPEAAGQGWLVQVELIPGGEKEYFSSLEDLFAFIRAQLPGAQGSGGAGPVAIGIVCVSCLTSSCVLRPAYPRPDRFWKPVRSILRDACGEWRI